LSAKQSDNFLLILQSFDISSGFAPDVREAVRLIGIDPTRLCDGTTVVVMGIRVWLRLLRCVICRFAGRIEHEQLLDI